MFVWLSKEFKSNGVFVLFFKANNCDHNEMSSYGSALTFVQISTSFHGKKENRAGVWVNRSLSEIE